MQSDQETDPVRQGLVLSPLNAFALALLALLVLAIAHATLYDAPFEDAYITYRYAENFAAGHGLVYNPGEVVDGYTSASWTVLLGLLAWVGLPLPLTAPLLSLLLGLVALALAADVARRGLGPEAGGVWPVLPAAVWAAHGGWAYYAASGMETMLFCALLVASVWLLTVAKRPWHLAAVGVLLAAGAATRPEGALYAAALILAVALTRSRRDAGTACLGFLALYGPFFAIHWTTYGYPFPNTYYAKASFSNDLLVRGLRHVETYLTSHAYWFPVLAAAWLGIRSKKRPLHLLLAAVTASCLLSTIVVGGDSFALYRFLLPQVPFAALALMLVAREASGKLAHRWRRPLAMLAVGCWLGGTVAVTYLPTRTFTTHDAKSQRSYYLDVARINAGYFKVGAWLRRRFPEETLLATNAAGIVPYVSHLRALDMLGVNDRHIAHVPIALGRGVPGHEKHDVAYVLARKPDIVFIGLPILASRPLRPEEFEHWVGRWFPYLPGDRELFFHPEFRRAYAPVGVDIDGGHLVLFVRRPHLVDH